MDDLDPTPQFTGFELLFLGIGPMYLQPVILDELDDRLMDAFETHPASGNISAALNAVVDRWVDLGWEVDGA